MGYEVLCCISIIKIYYLVCWWWEIVQLYEQLRIYDFVSNKLKLYDLYIENEGLIYIKRNNLFTDCSNNFDLAFWLVLLYHLVVYNEFAPLVST